MSDKKFTQVVAGLFTSKLIYCMTVWGGVWNKNDQYNNTSITKEAMRKLQVCQNKCLRLITGLDYNTSTKTLLDESKQLSVSQLVAYHSVCQVYRIKKSKLPAYHYKRLFKSPISEQNTRTRGTEKPNKIIDFDLSLARGSFFYQSSRLWDLLPNNIKEAKTIHMFKRKSKVWIKGNISVRP